MNLFCVLYASEIWAVALGHELRWMMCEARVLLRIFGLIGESNKRDGKLCNKKVNNLLLPSVFLYNEIERGDVDGISNTHDSDEKYTYEKHFSYKI
jgi:hypothetical protein